MQKLNSSSGSIDQGLQSQLEAGIAISKTISRRMRRLLENQIANNSDLGLLENQMASSSDLMQYLNFFRYDLIIVTVPR
jgi:hypothetical protein